MTAASSSPAARLARIISRDVTLQMADGLLMRRDDPVYEISDRDDANYLVLIHYRQVASAVLRHGSHAFFHIVARGHGDHRAGHDLTDQGLSRRAVIQNHLPRVIALGNDADQPAFGHDQQGAHSLFGHLLDALVN